MSQHSVNICLECQIHDHKWYITTHLGTKLCAKCCQYKLLSSDESDFTRRQLLELLDTSLKYGCDWMNSFRSNHFHHNERLAFILTFAGLLFNLDTRIRMFANNCLKLIVSQLNDHSINRSLLERLIENLITENNAINEYVLDLISLFLIDGPTNQLSSHRLQENVQLLVDRLQHDFYKFDDCLKRYILQIFIVIYNNIETNLLFTLEEEFHLTSLQMVLNVFDSQKVKSSDKLVLINALNLLKCLSSIDSIVDSLVSNVNIDKYLRFLINSEYEELKGSAYVWMSEMLCRDNIRIKLANILLIDSLDLYVETLQSSVDSFLSNNILECINLMLDSICRPISLTNITSLAKALIKTLELSAKSKDNKLFINAMTALRQLIERNCGTQLVTEFDFFALIELLEYFISDPQLYLIVVRFIADFLTISTVPVLIPTKRMKLILNKVLDNISKRLCGDDTEFINICIERTTATINLIKSYINLVKSLADNGLLDNEETFHLLTGEVKPVLNEQDLIDLMDTSPEGPIDTKSNEKDIQETEIFDFFSFCLQTIETFLIECIDRLIVDQNSSMNSQLFESLVSCCISVFQNNLFDAKEVNKMVVSLFSKGYVLTMVQILWFCEHSYITHNFKSCLVLFLSHLLYKIQQYDHRNDLVFQFDESCIEYFAHGFQQMNDQLMNRLNKFVVYEQNESIHKFYRTFFAVNYYSFKLEPKNDFQIEDLYNLQFIRILNQYLRRDLSYNESSVLTVKHALFLSTLIPIDSKSIASLRQFFEQQNNNFLSLYYTNHINLMNWLFIELKCNNFCEYALIQFFESIPEHYLRIEKKQIISSFFQLIHSNDKAIQILIQLICDTITNVSILAILEELLEDFEQFMDESDICNDWNKFCVRILENLPQIIIKIIYKLKTIFEDDLNPEDEQKVIQMLKILCQMISNNFSNIRLEVIDTRFDALFTELTNFIDFNRPDKTIDAIFKFFTMCFTSADQLDLNELKLTEILLNSQIVVILIVKHLESDRIYNELQLNSLKCLII
ncbi:uncharacterized protein LOC128965918 [Oppia nitens]|uniref:uncharacterized protein LOC128965918 n=1 Tax=Oppia nitens TaxID=1686743 RepID=UPI0023D996FF|nr:uncharacterized protein LOC128965918 [Oppia nitens]